MDIKKIQKNRRGGGTCNYHSLCTKKYEIIFDPQKLQIGSVALGNFLRAYFVSQQASQDAYQFKLLFEALFLYKGLTKYIGMVRLKGLNLP